MVPLSSMEGARLTMHSLAAGGMTVGIRPNTLWPKAWAYPGSCRWPRAVCHAVLRLLSSLLACSSLLFHVFSRLLASSSAYAHCSLPNSQCADGSKGGSLVVNPDFPCDKRDTPELERCLQPTALVQVGLPPTFPI